MERLTKKDNNYYQFANEVNNDYVVNEFNNNFYLKLQQLENIEEELCCPLEVLKPNQKVSFIKDNIIYDDIEVMGINIQNKEIMLGSSWSFTSLPLNLYGRTWWLKKTKEEE